MWEALLGQKFEGLESAESVGFWEDLNCGLGEEVRCDRLLVKAAGRYFLVGVRYSLTEMNDDPQIDYRKPLEIPNLLGPIMEVLLANLRGEVAVTDDPDLMADFLLNKRDELRHSWAGSKTVQVDVKVLYGSAEAGSHEKTDYSRNGAPFEETRNDKTSVRFDEHQPLVVLLKEYELDRFNGSHYTSEEERLVVYIPKQ